MRSWLILCAAVALCGALIGCRRAASDRRADATGDVPGQATSGTGEDIQGTSRADSQAQLQECANKMHLTFPASARLLGFHKLSGGPDDFVYLKVELRRADLLAFLKKSPFAGVQMRGDWRFPTPPDRDLDWWDVDRPKHFQSGQAMLPGPCGLDILIDEDQKDIVIVYLVWFET